MHALKIASSSLIWPGIDTRRTEAGFSLVMAIVFGLMLSLLGFMVLSALVAENRSAMAHLQAVQAFWLAESGVELTHKWLRDQDPPPAGTEPFVHYDAQPAGAGTFTVIVDPEDQNNSSYIKKYRVVSVGQVADARRRLEIALEMVTFNKYAYLTGDEGGTIWFNTGDVIEGPLHSNDQISITGSPVFMGKVTSSDTAFNTQEPYDPDFQEGYQLGVPEVDFPSEEEILDNYWVINGADPELIIDAENDKHASLVFDGEGTFTYNVWHWEDGEKIYDIQDAVVAVEEVNGMIYVKGGVDIEGTLDGVVTVLATDNIYITNDVLYEMSDAEGQPLADCDDILGLIALKNIIVADNTANRDDVIIHAALLTLDTSFSVENYWQGAPRGDLTIWGSLSQKVRGPVGTFTWWGGSTGYKKDYHYDVRFVSSPPPYYPVTGQYNFVYWKELTD